MDRREVLKNVALFQGMSDRELAAPLLEQALVQFGAIGMALLRARSAADS